MTRAFFQLGLAWLAGSEGAQAQAKVDYLQEIKPIFAETCYRCHAASQQKGDLRMDTAAFALKGGETGPGLVPGQSAQSLLIQVLQGTHEEIAQMPYKKPPLNPQQIKLIERWIDEGANAPTNEAPAALLHWSFVPPAQVSSPEVRQKAWPRNAIDAFVLARLEKEQIKPAPEADKTTLIRRLSLDLTGLPPSPGEVKAFIQDTDPRAYERLVERLLASPHYGERWGRHWLDYARYADSNGYSIDAPRSIWKYRDWVIDAFNRDLPFDRFVVEQLAGDLLPNATLEQKIATGFHRNTQINQEGGIDPEQFRVESVMDRANTTGTVFLGLTVGCAQCHDHKFDPISQKEYYQLLAFFNSTVEDGHGKESPSGVLTIPGPETAAQEQWGRQLKEAEAALDRYLEGRDAQLPGLVDSLAPGKKAKLKPDLLKRLASEPGKVRREFYAAIPFEDPEYKKLRSALVSLEKQKPKPVTTLVMFELKAPRETMLFIQGDFTRPGPKVTPGVPAVLPPLALDKSRARPEGALADRLDLARWIVDPQNPLTARVTVNRFWQTFFGRGLVATENDFGTQGSPPSHPELLDYLANQFMSGGWSQKALHRLIVSSATYRQSSRVREDLAVVDPNNKLLARQARMRLEAEIVRDLGLSASGLLYEKIGGPSVFPPQPAGVMTLGQSRRDWIASTGPERYRRGLYTFFWRATPHPALMVFDSADGFGACTRRLRSNTPLQALTLLNDEAFYEFARGLGRRLFQEEPRAMEARMDLAFRLCLSRGPTEDEKQLLLNYLEKEAAALELAPAEAQAILGPGPHPAGQEIKQLAAWTLVARVLLNLDETISRE